MDPNDKRALGAMRTLINEIYGSTAPEETENTRASVVLRDAYNALNTVEDAIAFFAKNGKYTDVKFVYCVPRSVRGIMSYNPYELNVFHPSCTSEPPLPFSLLSPTGMVHMDEQNTCEFCPLPEFMRESVCFKVLRQMDFFSKFYIIKTFLKFRSRVAARTTHNMYDCEYMRNEKILRVDFGTSDDGLILFHYGDQECKWHILNGNSELW